MICFFRLIFLRLRSFFLFFLLSKFRSIHLFELHHPIPDLSMLRLPYGLYLIVFLELFLDSLFQHVVSIFFYNLWAVLKRIGLLVPRLSVSFLFCIAVYILVHYWGVSFRMFLYSSGLSSWESSIQNREKLNGCGSGTSIWGRCISLLCEIPKSPKGRKPSQKITCSSKLWILQQVGSLSI